MALVYQGTKIASGIALGRVQVVEKLDLELPQYSPKDCEQEIAIFCECHGAVVQEMKRTLQEARDKLGEHDAEILDAHLTLLQDEYSVVEPIKEAIRDDGLNMAQAIERVMGDIITMFRQAEDEYMRMRANDAEDVRRHLLSHVLGIDLQDYSVLPKGTILVAEELTPSDTIRMDLKHVSGIVTALGGYYSHVGIIARNLGIPSVCDMRELVDILKNGDTVIVDGDEGSVTVNPDCSELTRFENRRRQKEYEAKELLSFRFKPSCSLNGDDGLICANIGSVAEAEIALAAGAEGIGLLRSEFLYMDQAVLPDEETQFEAYREVVKTMCGRPVIIRTLDVGGDKQLPSLPMAKEENPFLGCRAIRLCLDRQDLFRTQLRALLRASVYGNLQIMFPMISSVEELRNAKNLLEQIREELKAEGVQTAPVPIGIMIEVPAAALLADYLAKEVDFFSIGTNDLIQYTVAAERGNRAVENLYSPYYPAVLRLINMAARAAEREKIYCGMCGEAAADPDLLPVFWGMGLRELSMSANAITRARETLSHWRTEDCQSLAERVLNCASKQDVQDLICAEKQKNSIKNSGNF